MNGFAAGGNGETVGVADGGGGGGGGAGVASGAGGKGNVAGYDTGGGGGAGGTCGQNGWGSGWILSVVPSTGGAYTAPGVDGHVLIGYAP